MFLKPPPGVVAATAPLTLSTMLLIALALLAPFALYFATVKSIVAIWDSSETFAHGYVILPISLWLIWRRRANFSALPPTPFWPALALLALVGAGWLAARVGEVQVVQQYAFVAMLPVIALAVLGRRLAGSLAFPLLFLLFAVPFGEVFVAPLINFTADFTVAAVQATGIPVLRNGTRFELPTGNWSVVEACSGVRYLISSITLGCLYAYLTYRSTTRRLLFVALSIVVPVIANGLRAYMIVMIGHFSGMTLATGVDHIIYGWLFFGLVMFLMFWIGSYWREDTDVVPATRGPRAAATVRPVAAGRMGPMVLAVIALSALWPAFASYNDQANFNPKPVKLDPIAVSWPQAPSFASWKPSYMTPDAEFSGVFRAPGAVVTQPVSLNVLYYRNQNRDKALISSLNRVAGWKDPWLETASARRTETIAGRAQVLRESTMHGPTGSMLVWHWLWVDQQHAASDYAGKLLQARAKLLFHGDDGAVVMVAAPYFDKPDEARTALRAFLEANSGALDAALLAAHHD